MSQYFLIILLYLLSFFVNNSHVSGDDNHHHISKRFLLFPPASVFQFSMGLSSPLILPRRSINLSAVLQVNYDYPYNLSNFMPMTISARGTVENFYDLDRRTFYRFLIDLLDNIGIEGEQCLLRTICEISETPMHTEGKNLLLETLVHFIFTPSLDLTRQSPIISQNYTLSFNDRLLMAEDFGKLDEDCMKVFNECDVPLVDLFTTKYMIS